MSESKTKKALIGSAGALVLCFALLLGTTFAWFTDNASTKVNKIQAGNLDVALEMKKGDGWVSAEGETLNFIDKEGNSIESTLWEPGCTYYLPTLKVTNDGDLALKYKVEFGIADGDKELAEVLDVYLGDKNVGTLKAMLESTDQDGYVHGNLTAEQETDELSISLRMQKTAGNEYRGKSIAGIYVTVLATQDTVESDSIDNQYDADATFTYSVYNIDDLVDAFKSGAASITLEADIDYKCLSDSDIPFFSQGQGNRGCLMNVTKNATLDTNGHSIKVDSTNHNFIAAAIVEKGAKLTIVGDGKIEVSAEDGDYGTYGVWARGGSIDIMGSTFVNSNKLDSSGVTCVPLVYISEQSGAIHIYGGTYVYPGCAWCQSCTNASNGLTQKVLVVHEGALFNQSFFMEWSDYPRIGLADGCELQQTDIDGTTWYKVVKK